MLSPGQFVTMKGNITMLGFVDQWSGTELERRVGYGAGRLANGCAILALVRGQALRPEDIQLRGSTRWSGGYASPQGKDVEDLLGDRGQNISEVKQRLCRFFAANEKNRPAKVVPFIPHGPNATYPDAEALGAGIPSGIPQFNLIVPRLFEVVRVHAKY